MFVNAPTTQEEIQVRDKVFKKGKKEGKDFRDCFFQNSDSKHSGRHEGPGGPCWVKYGAINYCIIAHSRFCAPSSRYFVMNASGH
uniref:SFRICE_020698 n=1 Tax=Spodoptera frugiperda TaxID=7108 RepID=A0A2H1VLM4_SPOFR